MLKYRKIKNNGRNMTGQITVYHKGGGLTNNYRYIDSLRKLYNLPGIIKTIEYDPNRTGKISLINYNIFTINTQWVNSFSSSYNNNKMGPPYFKDINRLIPIYKVNKAGGVEEIMNTYYKYNLYKYYFNYILFLKYSTISTFKSYNLLSYILAPSNIHLNQIVLSQY